MERREVWWADLEEPRGSEPGFRRPLLIIFTIPLAFTGAFLGVVLFRAPFDFFATLGLFSLAGVIINNGIVLIDRIDTEQENGLSPYDAIIAAALSRLRPISLTTITTVWSRKSCEFIAIMTFTSHPAVASLYIYFCFINKNHIKSIWLCCNFSNI